MLGLASYAMRGPFQAALPAAAFLLLALVFPPVIWLSGAVIALVFLRKGYQSGSQAMLVATAAVCLMLVWLAGSLLAGLELAAVFWLPTVALALLLRQTANLSFTLRIAGLFALVMVAGMYLVLSDPAAFWYKMLQQQLPVNDLSQQLGVDAQLFENALRAASRLMSGAFVAVMMMGAIISLLLARFWQAGLFNPGGFGEDFRQLRLGRNAAAISIGICVLAMVSGLPIFSNIAPIVIVVFFLQGLAVLHALALDRKMHKGWLVGIYLLLIFLFPHTLILLGALGMADNWLNVGKRVNV